MKKELKHNDFVQKPKLLDGKDALSKIIKLNLVYPEKAITNKIEGIVYLSYEVDGNGKIKRVKVTKGIGFGCNEEAIRLIKMLKYSAVNNRNMKIHLHQNAKIKFTLPKLKNEQKQKQNKVENKAKTQINYVLKTEKNKKENTITYTINL